MGSLAAAAVPDLVAELARVRRYGGHFESLESDEDLQETCRVLIGRLM
jgi:hypothetical protein